MDATDAPFEQCNLYQLTLGETQAHGGTGWIRFARVATHQTLAGACNFIDYARLPPGATVGEHTHGEGEEEFYLILSGVGEMRLNGRVFPVRPGDLVRNPPGGTHALINTGPEELQMFVFEIQVRL
ncbi:MAG: cupin domain-containing protein [Candidatus Entotheonellia bacterium]